MKFLEQLAATLPGKLALEELVSLQPEGLWMTAPRLAAVNALAMSGGFDTADYLHRYPDVEQARMDPISHFVNYGLDEGRYFRTPPQPTPTKAGDAPLVSVLVPVFNNTPYLRECIESVIGQTLRQIEIILLNDGSTDPAANAILAEYAAEDKRIKLINKKNTGYGHTMNVGLGTASGKYIGIVEADDYVDRRFYETLYDIAERTGADIAKCSYAEITGNGPGRQSVNRHIINENNTKRVLDANTDPMIFYDTCGLITCSAIYRHQFLLDNKIKYNETPGASYQDTSFWLKTLALAKRQYYIPDCLYHYRKDNAASSVKDTGKLLPICHEHMTIKRFIYTHNLYQRFYPSYQRHLFINYRWNMNRASESARAEFAPRFRADFVELIIAGKFNSVFFQAHEKQYLDEIVKGVQVRTAIIFIENLDYGAATASATALSNYLKGRNWAVCFVVDDESRIACDFYGELVFSRQKNFDFRKLLVSADLIVDYRQTIDELAMESLEHTFERHAYKYVGVITSKAQLESGGFLDAVTKCAMGNLARLGALVCVSPVLMRTMVELCGCLDNIKTIPLAVDYAELERSNMLCRRVVADEYILIITANVGECYLDVVLPAFLAAEISWHMRLVVAGGLTEAHLRDFVHRHPRSDRIVTTDIEELPSLLKYARFLLHPYRDVSPAMLQALALGLPVLAHPDAAEGIVTPNVKSCLLQELSPDALARDMERMAAAAPAMRSHYRRFNPCADSSDSSRQIASLAEFVHLGEPGGLKLSVIIPVYNTEKWLKECLRSAAAQTLRELEIICIDDGSTDGSAAIIREFPDSRIRYHSQANSGSGLARNSGLSLARGEFVAFLDSDDFLPERHSYAELWRNAKENAVMVSGGNVSSLDAREVVLPMTTQENVFSHKAILRYSDWQYDYGYQSFIYNRKFLLGHGIVFPPYLRYQDPIFFVRAMQAADLFCVHPIVSYCWRERRSPKSHWWTAAMAADMLLACRDNLEFAKEHCLPRLHNYTVAHAGGFYNQIKPLMGEDSVKQALRLFNESVSSQYLGFCGNNLFAEDVNQ